MSIKAGDIVAFIPQLRGSAQELFVVESWNDKIGQGMIFPYPLEAISFGEIVRADQIEKVTSFEGDLPELLEEARQIDYLSRLAFPTEEEVAL